MTRHAESWVGVVANGGEVDDANPLPITGTLTTGGVAPAHLGVGVATAVTNAGADIYTYDPTHTSVIVQNVETTALYVTVGATPLTAGSGIVLGPLASLTFSPAPSGGIHGITATGTTHVVAVPTVAD